MAVKTPKNREQPHAIRHRLGRRGFLCGLGGVALGLPILASLRHQARASLEDAPRRLVVFFQCNGVDTQRFWPAGPYGQLTPQHFSDACTLAPLASHADRLLIPRGMFMVPTGLGLPGNSHMRGLGHSLTASRLDDFTKYANGPSIDHVIANHVHPDTAPLNLLVGSRTGNIYEHISFSGAKQPVTAENNPWSVYQDLIGLSQLAEEARERLIARRESVLDLVSEEYKSLLAEDLSSADRARLDMHFTHVRELEIGLQDTGLTSCELPAASEAQLAALDPDTVGHDINFREVGKLQLELLVLALACGRTQVATLQWGPGSGGPVYTWDGMEHLYNHHVLSHANTQEDESGDPIEDYRDQLFEIDRWYASLFTELLDRLAAYEEGEATLLDHSAVLWINELSDGLTHDHRDLPWVMAGSCGGYFKTGQYLKVTEQPEVANEVDAAHNLLLTSLLRAHGVQGPDGEPIARFGDPDTPAGELDIVKLG